MEIIGAIRARAVYFDLLFQKRSQKQKSHGLPLRHFQYTPLHSFHSMNFANEHLFLIEGLEAPILAPILPAHPAEI
jgi:hypothetical protein